MLHLGDALGFSYTKVGSAQGLKLNDTIKILWDLSDGRLNFTAAEIAATIKHLGRKLCRLRQTLPETVKQDTIATVFPQSVDGVFAAVTVAGLSWAAAPLSPDASTESFAYQYSVLKPTFVLVHPSCSKALTAAQETGVPVVEMTWEFPEGQTPLPQIDLKKAPQADGPSRKSTSAISLSLESGELDEVTESMSFLTPHETDVCFRYRKHGTAIILPLTHRNVVVSMANIHRCYGFQGATDIEGVDGELVDTVFCVAPIYSLHGLVACCLSMLAIQAGVVIGEFRAETFWSTVTERRATWSSLLPYMILKLLQQEKRTPTVVAKDALAAVRRAGKAPEFFRFLRVTSLHLDAELMKSIEEEYGVPVLLAYSTSTACHQVTSNGYPSFDNRLPGAVGQVTGCEICVLNDDHECVPRGHEGTIWIRGYNVVDGYEGGENIKEMDAQDFLLHNSIEWCLAKPPSFASSANEIGSDRFRLYSSYGSGDETAPSTTATPAAITPSVAITPTVPGSQSAQADVKTPSVAKSADGVGLGSSAPSPGQKEDATIPLGPSAYFSRPPSTLVDSPSTPGTGAHRHYMDTTEQINEYLQKMEPKVELPEQRNIDEEEKAMAPIVEGAEETAEGAMVRHISYHQATSATQSVSGTPQAAPTPAFSPCSDLLMPVSPAPRTSSGRRGTNINRFASGLVAYTGDFPNRTDPMISPLPLIMRWVNTHDKGRMDEEGRVFITSHAAHVVRVETHIVSTDRVEKQLRREPEVSQAMVVGVPHGATGERLVALIVADTGDVHEFKHSFSRTLLAKYPRYEVPSEIHLINKLPSQSDRVARRQLAEVLLRLYDFH